MQRKPKTRTIIKVSRVKMKIKERVKGIMNDVAVEERGTGRR